MSRRPLPAPEPTAAYHSPLVIESEMALLGVMMWDAPTRDLYAQLLSPRDFYRDCHAALFGYLQTVAAANRDCDFLTILADLEAEGRVEALGGREYLFAVSERFSHVKMAPEYARRVVEASAKRRIADASHELLSLSASPAVPAADLLERAERLVGEAGTAHASETCQSAAEIIAALDARYEARQENPGAMLGLPSGHAAVDGLLNGLQAPNMIVIGSRPGMGKSSLLTSICAHAALHGHPTLIFSMEMSREEVMTRIICAMARVDSHALAGGRLTESEYERYSTAAGVLYGAPLHIDDRSGMTPGYVRSVMRRFRQERGGLGLVGIDYVQLMKPDARLDNPVQALSEVSREVKALARDFAVPVIALAQVGRQVETREDKRPYLSDLKECGQFEQDADIVAFLYNEGYYRRGKADHAEPPGDAAQEMEFIVRKHRNGPLDTVRLGFVPRYTRFERWAD